MNQQLLIIDDDVWVTKVLHKILTNLGYTKVEIAHNGFDGIAAALELEPKIIFLDLMMPEIDGITTMKVIRKIPQTSDIKIIICSANSDITHISKTIQIGANDFISKPFTSNTINEKLTKFLFTE